MSPANEATAANAATTPGPQDEVNTKPTEDERQIKELIRRIKRKLIFSPLHPRHANTLLHRLHSARLYTPT